METSWKHIEIVGGEYRRAGYLRRHVAAGDRVEPFHRDKIGNTRWR